MNHQGQVNFGLSVWVQRLSAFFFLLFYLEQLLLSLHTNICPSGTCHCYVRIYLFLHSGEPISSQPTSVPLPQGVLHPVSLNSHSHDLGRTTPNVLLGCVITEYLMGMQGHLDLQSQVLALQLMASSIIDRGKPIRTICSPQRSAGAA